MNEESRFDYHQWIREKEWQNMAEKCKADAGYKCQVCGDPNDLQAHHNIYRRYNGDEQPGDLCCLCNACHTLFHSYHVIRDGRLYRTFNVFHGAIVGNWVEPAANQPTFQLPLEIDSDGC